MEEDETKIRRNLVVFGALVCGLTYLDGSLSIGFLSLIGLKVENPPLHKVLAIACCVLLYFSVRYKFSNEGRTYLIAVKKAINVATKIYAMREVDELAALYGRSGIEAPIFEGMVSDAIETTLKDDPMRRPTGAGLGVRPKITVQRFGIQTQNPLALTIGLTLHWPPLKYGGSSSTPQFQTTLSGYRARRATVMGWVEVNLHSLESIQYVVPLLLGNAAGLCLLYKSISLYL